MKKTHNSHFDATIYKNDSRNVINKYKGWSVEAIKDELSNHAFPFHIAIENFQHDYNIGTIVRNANAFNVSSVHIIGKRQWNRRGAMATEKYLTLHHHPDVTSFVTSIQASQLRIIGVDNIDGSISLGKADLPANAIYVFGQEGPGLSDEMKKLCDYIVRINQYGSTRSINVGVASGIVLHEWTRRHTH